MRVTEKKADALRDPMLRHLWKEIEKVEGDDVEFEVETDGSVTLASKVPEEAFDDDYLGFLPFNMHPDDNPEKPK